MIRNEKKISTGKKDNIFFYALPKFKLPGLTDEDLQHLFQQFLKKFKTPGQKFH